MGAEVIKAVNAFAQKNTVSYEKAKAAAEQRQLEDAKKVLAKHGLKAVPDVSDKVNRK